MGLLLLILLVLFLGGSYPSWNHSRNWGYRPFSLFSTLLLVLIVLLFMDVIHFRTF